MTLSPRQRNSVASVIALVLCASSPPVSTAQTEVENPGSGPDIWVDWNEVGDPELDQHFTVSFADEGYPDLELITGSLSWVIWSVDTSNPNDIGDFGDITVDTTVADDFNVVILNGDTLAAGARDILSITMQPDG